MTLAIVTAALVIALISTALLYALFQRPQDKGYRLEVEPTEAALVKDIFTGEVRAYLPGNYTLTLGFDRVVGGGSLKDEPWNPPPEGASTADKVNVTLDLVVVKQKILQLEEGPDAERITLEAIRKAWTEISYENRNQLIGIKIAAAWQNALIIRKLEDLFDAEEEEVGALASRTKYVVKKDMLKEIEEEINQYLVTNVTEPWGVEVLVEVHDAKLPERLQEVAEEIEAAAEEGRATQARAGAAGVTVQEAFWGEVLVDALPALWGPIPHNRGSP